MPRATALSADERRAALVQATIPLLYEHGRAVTTRLIAEAAQVAEGTIFRVFDTKEDLVRAAVVQAFEPTAYEAELRAIDPQAALEDRLVAHVSALQRRFTRVFTLMDRMGLAAPPEEMRAEFRRRWEARLDELTRRVVGADADRLRFGLEHTLHVVRLLTFAATHPEISHGHPLTAEQVVDLLLHGILEED